MIITQSPLRITLGGGGTDLPSYYRKYGGFVISAAIDKYVFVSLHRCFKPEYSIKYSEYENVRNISEIRHPIVRTALEMLSFKDYVEISSMANIPAGTGLGSSGSYTTALLQAIHTWQKNVISQRSIAEEACEIEIVKLKEPVGKQDQYIAAFGGVTCFTFNEDDSVDVEPISCSEETLNSLEDGLCLFFTGYTRSASAILKDQDERSKKDDGLMLDNLHYTKELGRRSLDALCASDLQLYAALMHEHWEHKRRRSDGMTNKEIDRYYRHALDNGAMGGQLIGAGGGGFLLFYSEEKRRLRRAMSELGLQEVRFRFDFEGCKTMIGY